MAIDFNLPVLTTLKASVLTYIVDNIKAVAKMDFTSASNIPTGSVRWSSASNRFEKWNGTAWESLDGRTATIPEINAVCSGNTATAEEIIKSSKNIGVTKPRQKVVEIGDWDMDATAYVNVPHGLTLSKIRGARVVVRDDESSSLHGVSTNYTGFPDLDGFWQYIDSTNIRIYRETGGNFDTTSYNATSFNRGWVIFDYVD